MDMWGKEIEGYSVTWDLIFILICLWDGLTILIHCESYLPYGCLIQSGLDVIEMEPRDCLGPYGRISNFIFNI